MDLSDFKRNDKVQIVYGEGGAETFVGFVDSITDQNLVLHEYVNDIYWTLLIDNIIEIDKA